MCGIAGLFHGESLGQRDGELREFELREVARRMADAIAHRGPDDAGVWVDAAAGLALAHRRLSIIDLSAAGHQPMGSASGRFQIVFNGEIYNFAALRDELLAHGHVFRTHSDTETIVHAYEQWGVDCVQRFRGMFAFALWDARRGRLLVGRDRLGIKPLYLWNDGRRLAFASEAKAILALPGVDVELDRNALASYLSIGYVASPGSMFRGMRKLPPATLLAARGAALEERRYWRIPSEVDGRRSEDEWVELVRRRVEESVRMQMVSEVPIGAFLSGGIDSSAVVAFMAAHSDRPVKTYAIGFGGGKAEAYYNELPYARQVAQLFKTDHHEIVVSPDVVSMLPSLLWHMDEPIADTAFITTYLVSEFARRDVTVILSGVGGDELFGGYRRYLGGHYQSRFNRLPLSLRRAASALGERLPSDRHSPMLNSLRLAKGFLSTAGLPLDERYRSYVEVFADDEIAALMPSGPSPGRDPIAEAFRAAAGGDELNRMLAVDAETQLPDDLLLLTDKMSMAVSLECRVPLLDQRLVELAARMPGRLKVGGGDLKHAMKRALAGVLPEGILKREKRGFGAPIGAWFRQELAPLVADLLSPETVRRRGLLDPDAVARTIAEHEAQRADRTDHLLALVNLEIWARLYLDGASVSAVTVDLKSKLAA